MKRHSTKVHKHAYNMVMRWLRDGTPATLPSKQWRWLRCAVVAQYQENKNKIRRRRRRKHHV